MPDGGWGTWSVGLTGIEKIDTFCLKRGEKPVTAHERQSFGEDPVKVREADHYRIE